MSELENNVGNFKSVTFLIVRSFLAVVCSLVANVHVEAQEYMPFIAWLLLGGQFFLPKESIRKLFKVHRFLLVAGLLVVILVMYAV